MMHIAIEVPENIMEIVKQRSQREHLDEKASLKQLLCMGAEKYHIKSSISYSRFVKGISNAEAI